MVLFRASKADRTRRSDLARAGRTVTKTTLHALQGLRVPSHAAPGHFYSPIPSRRDVRRAVALEPSTIGIALHRERQLELLARITPGSAGLLDGPRYQPDNGMFSVADASLLRALLRTIRPARYVEVGSGFSSAAALDAAECDDLPTAFTFIEPYPARLEGLLSDRDRARVTIHRRFVQDVAPEVFSSLTDGDVLFIDSTHVSKAGSDVNHLFFRVIPALAVGVWVHVHDIHWPFEYPKQWLESGRAWNENYLLRSFLTFNDSFEIQLFGSQLLAEEPVAFAALAGTGPDRDSGSIWIRRVR